MTEILHYLGYLLVLAVLFAVAAAVGYVGLSLRIAFRRRRVGHLAIGIIGLLVLAGIGVAIARSGDSIGGVVVYSVIVVILLALGFSGRLIVPEGLGGE